MKDPEREDLKSSSLASAAVSAVMAELDAQKLLEGLVLEDARPANGKKNSPPSPKPQQPKQLIMRSGADDAFADWSCKQGRRGRRLR